MREPPHIIKALNALRRTSFDEPIKKVSFISEEMAIKLVELGYAEQTPWSKDPQQNCYRLTKEGIDAINAKPAPRGKWD